MGSARKAWYMLYLRTDVQGTWLRPVSYSGWFNPSVRPALFPSWDSITNDADKKCARVLTGIVAGKISPCASFGYTAPQRYVITEGSVRETHFVSATLQSNQAVWTLLPAVVKLTDACSARARSDALGAPLESAVNSSQRNPNLEQF
jgi:hypothetical protein